MRSLAIPVLIAALAGAACQRPPADGRAPSEATSLVQHLPDVLPDISTWERSSGFAEFDSPRHSFEYELYVDPTREATYAITRYWVHVDDPEEARKADITDTEKLQWDVDGRTLRRFECRPAGAAGPCDWVELEFASHEYKRELKPILAIYSIHRNLLYERDLRGEGPQ